MGKISYNAGTNIGNRLQLYKKHITIRMDDKNQMVYKIEVNPHGHLEISINKKTIIFKRGTLNGYFTTNHLLPQTPQQAQ